MITYDNIESACSVVRETITEMSMSKGSQQASVFCGNERHETKGSSAIVTLAGKFPCHLDKAIEVTNKATLSMVLPHVAAPWNKDKKCETVSGLCLQSRKCQALQFRCHRSKSPPLNLAGTDFVAKHRWVGHHFSPRPQFVPWLSTQEGKGCRSQLKHNLS